MNPTPPSKPTADGPIRSGGVPLLTIREMDAKPFKDAWPITAGQTLLDLIVVQPRNILS